MLPRWEDNRRRAARGGSDGDDGPVASGLLSRWTPDEQDSYTVASGGMASLERLDLARLRSEVGDVIRSARSRLRASAVMAKGQYSADVRDVAPGCSAAYWAIPQLTPEAARTGRVNDSTRSVPYSAKRRKSAGR